MTERFEKLFKLSSNLYSAGSPIIILDGVLLKDSKSGQIVAQLKIQSISPKIIKAAKVSLKAFDISGEELPGVTNYQYLELNKSNGQVFGPNKAIILPNVVIRSFMVSSVIVIFEDNTIWESSAEFKSLPAAEILSLGHNEIEKQYQIATNAQVRYSPCSHDIIWQCTCGTWNSSVTCTHCSANKDIIFSALDIPNLTEQMKVRLSQEAEMQRITLLKEARIKAEIEAKQRLLYKKILSAIAIASTIGMTLFFILWLYPCLIVPNARYSEAETLLAEGKLEEAIDIFQELGDYHDSSSRVVEIIDTRNASLYTTAEQFVATGELLKAKSVFEELGDYSDSRKRVDDLWDKITVRETLSAGGYHTVGLKNNGTVIATGLNNYGQCNVSQWHDIIAVSAGDYHTVALSKNGTVLATGDNSYGQCNISEWFDIVAISAGNYYTIGLKSDGTVVSAGTNYFGQSNVDQWTEIIAICAGYADTIGLKSDGTVVVAGFDDYVSRWENIVAIGTGVNFVLGVESDGSVRITGSYAPKLTDASNLTDILSISAFDHIGALKRDGTVVAIGNNEFGECDVSEWTDIVALSTGHSHTVGLKSDSSVIATGDNQFGQCNVTDWERILIPKLQ